MPAGCSHVGRIVLYTGIAKVPFVVFKITDVVGGSIDELCGFGGTKPAGIKRRFEYRVNKYLGKCTVATAAVLVYRQFYVIGVLRGVGILKRIAAGGG